MLNKVIIMGRLTKNPELRRTQSGTAVTSFSIACERDYKQGDQKATDFLEVVAWRNTAEYVSKYFAKGRMAIIEGRLQVREWQDKDGNNRRTTEILAESVYFGDSKPGNGNNGNNAAAPAANNQNTAPQSNSSMAPGLGDFTEIDMDDEDGDLPF